MCCWGAQHEENGAGGVVNEAGSRIDRVVENDNPGSPRRSLPTAARVNPRKGEKTRVADHANDQNQMTDETPLPRFLVRRGARRDWMVWHRHTKGPAMFQGHLVVGLSE